MKSTTVNLLIEALQGRFLEIKDNNTSCILDLDVHCFECDFKSKCDALDNTYGKSSINDRIKIVEHIKEEYPELVI